MGLGKYQKHNFSAGPAVLPRSVIEAAADAVNNWNDSGLSLIEVSHRGKDFVAVMEKVQNQVRELMALTDDYEVLFLQGGASMQFCQVPMNILDQNGHAAYTETGTWAKNAIQEAKAFGKVTVVASSADKKFTYIPKGYEIPKDCTYFHCTSNNTIFGTQMHAFPDAPVPMICDMSSDIFSRPVDFKKFDLIYAGAQKNMGPAGATLVVVKKDLLGKVSRHIPTMLDYRSHIEKESMYNTPPVFAVFVSMLTMEWILDQGGLTAMEKRNRKKAEMLYAEVDRNPLFRGTTAVEDRSWMNATFVLEKPDLEEEFLTLCKSAGIVGLKGHRSVGGFRASMYNALEPSSVEALTEVMSEFTKKMG